MSGAHKQFQNHPSALIDVENYQKMYEASLTHPQEFFGQLAREYLHWHKTWDEVIKGSFQELPVSWFCGGEISASYNCLDRHLKDNKNKIAVIWEGDEPTQNRKLTYGELHEDVCRFANALTALGAGAGDRIAIYLPMIPEMIIAMLAASRIGAIHSVVFSGFSSQALKQRIINAECKILITADEGRRGGKTIPLLDNVRSIVDECPSLNHTIVVKHTKQKNNLTRNMHWYHEVLVHAGKDCKPLALEANHPLFLLYTSGSTGKPKGIVHGIGGYLLHAAASFKMVFNYDLKDIYWCTADAGWITGHSYVVYGPLSQGATVFICEGTWNYPNTQRFLNLIDKHQINIFYTAPTLIRALKREGENILKSVHLSSLKCLGSVGEPISPDVWQWYFNKIGKSRCPVVDTWWQTETGGIMITPLPYATKLKPGSAGVPFLGVEPKIVNKQGKELQGEAQGDLVISKPWPGMLQGIYGDNERFYETYFSQYPNYYFSGDGALRDKEGYFWISGRVDDVINVSGHRIETAEVEAALVGHPKVAEAAVVGVPDALKGEGILAFVVLQLGESEEGNLKEALRERAKIEIGAIAKPDRIIIVDDLPKTRSGKIMRRILRKIAEHQPQEIGDTSTLANPEIVEVLIKQFET